MNGIFIWSTGGLIPTGQNLSSKDVTLVIPGAHSQHSTKHPSLGSL